MKNGDTILIGFCYTSWKKIGLVLSSNLHQKWVSILFESEKRGYRKKKLYNSHRQSIEKKSATHTELDKQMNSKKKHREKNSEKFIMEIKMKFPAK